MHLRLLYLAEIQLHRRRAAEDRDRHAQLVLVVVHVLDVAVKVRERAILHTHRFAHLEQHFRARLLHAFLDLVQDVLHLFLRDRRGFGRRAADEAGHLRRVLHEVPGVVGHLHLDQHVAREELALADVLLAAFHLDHFLNRHEDLPELLRQTRALDAIEQRALHAFFKARIRVHDIPPLAHQSTWPRNFFTIHRSVASTPHRNSAMTTTNRNTAPVVWSVSLRVRHTTFFVSAIDSCA